MEKVPPFSPPGLVIKISVGDTKFLGKTTNIISYETTPPHQNSGGQKSHFVTYLLVIEELIAIQPVIYIYLYGP